MMNIENQVELVMIPFSKLSVKMESICKDKSIA